MNELQKYWLNLKARFEVIYIPNFKTFLNFQAIAWKSLLGKYGIIDGREVESNGGFRFYQMEISKLPVSRSHTY